MVWREDIEEHYNNVDKAYDVLRLLDDNEIEVRNGIQTIILEELIKSCECIIEWLDDDSNVNSEISRLFIDSLKLGYDICIIIEARTFIYQLLGKSLADLLNVA